MLSLVAILILRALTRHFAVLAMQDGLVVITTTFDPGRLRQ